MTELNILWAYKHSSQSARLSSVNTAQAAPGCTATCDATTIFLNVRREVGLYELPLPAEHAEGPIEVAALLDVSLVISRA